MYIFTYINIYMIYIIYIIHVQYIYICKFIHTNFECFLCLMSVIKNTMRHFFKQQGFFQALFCYW